MGFGKFRVKWLAVTLLIAVLFASGLTVCNVSHAATAPPQAESKNATGILFIGLSGISPDDFETNLEAQDSRLPEPMRDYVYAALTPRSFNPFTCATEGWMGLRATGDVFDEYGRDLASVSNETCFSLNVKPDGPRATLPDFQKHLGKTTWPKTALFATDALAVGNLAGIPLASASGKIPHWTPLPDAAEPNATALPEDFKKILDSAPSDVLVDLDTTKPETLRDAEGKLDKTLLAESKSLQLQRLQTLLLANLTSSRPRPVLVASLSDVGQRSLHFFATNAFPSSGEPQSGLVATSTTRATGLITMTDLRALIVSARQAENPDLTIPRGLIIPDFTIHLQDSTAALRAISAEQKHAQASLLANATWYQVFHYLVWLGLLGAVIIAFGSLKFPKLRKFWGKVQLLNEFAFAFVPAALLLNFLPWWAGAPDRFSAQAISLGLTVGLAAVLVLGGRVSRHPVAFLAAVAFALLAVDIILGSAHQRNGFMGSLVLASRRYYGVSNRTYLILIIAGLLLTIPWIQKYFSTKSAALGLGAVGLVALLVDALPMWGADFGGPPGIIAAFGAAAILAGGGRLRWWHVPVWLVASVGAMLGVGFISSRLGSSHISSFWSTLGSPENTALIGGKIRDVLRSFTARGDIIALLIVAAFLVVALVWALHRLGKTHPEALERFTKPTSEPGYRALALGILLGVLIAVPINDSGALMIKEAIYLALPPLVAWFAASSKKFTKVSP